jgi:hypothetical protein
LFWNVSEYYRSRGEDPWDALPVTFHIDQGVGDPEFKRFMEYHARAEAEIKQMEKDKADIIK